MYHWAIFDPILNLFWQNAIVVNGKMKKVELSGHTGWGKNLKITQGSFRRDVISCGRQRLGEVRN